VTPLLLAFGLWEGLWTDRWGPSAELARAPERLALLPRAVGPWHSTDQQLGERQAKRAGFHGHLLRQYTHAETGETLTVLVACGPPGPMGAHTPEVCYGGSGFTQLGSRVLRQVPVEGQSAPAGFWVERYQKTGAALAERLQIDYAWNASEGWTAADSPRLQFARARVLWKLYVIRPLPRDPEATVADPVSGFLQLFVPQLDRCLFAAPGPTAERRASVHPFLPAEFA
jgi:hypothetical protein